MGSLEDAVDLGRGERHGQTAREREIAVDVAVAHRVADVVEAAPAGVEERQGGVPAEVGDELGEGVVPAVHPAAVATAGAGPAVLALDEHDVDLGREPLDRERRPEAGEPAADDAHVGALGARQRHDVARPPARVAALPVDGSVGAAESLLRRAPPIRHPRSLLQPHRRRSRRRLVGATCPGRSVTSRSLPSPLQSPCGCGEPQGYTLDRTGWCSPRLRGRSGATPAKEAAMKRLVLGAGAQGAGSIRLRHLVGPPAVAGPRHRPSDIVPTRRSSPPIKPPQTQITGDWTKGFPRL